MDILNSLPPKKFEAIDDLLAFISIYDDKKRTSAYKKMLRENAALIKGRTCVEAGAGLGIMSEHLAMLGAKKVYAVEVNPHLYEICQSRLSKYKNVEVIKADIRDFKPQEKIDLLLHELFGQLLFDEDIHVLHELSFHPQVVMPDRALLNYGTTNLKKMKDAVIDKEILNRLNGALVSGLFDAGKLKPKDNVVEWNYGKPLPTQVKATIKNIQHELLYFGLEIYHGNKFVCRSEECNNWAFVWTPLAGKSFRFDFSKRKDRLMEPKFEWI